ncbi:MAG TPA: DsbA family protein [Myxococcota bacterium]|nr:DsbA family protein [Myxococcota bacterium]
MEEVKLYFDYKSPFAYLAAEPAFGLAESYQVRVRWIPFTLRIKGKGERSQYSEWKARYSYLDARRWANARGGFPIRGPRKVYDTAPALIGGLYAMRAGVFRDYTLQAYARFFDHRLELDVADQIAALLAECGGSADDYRAFLAGDGPKELEACIEEAHADHVFGVPLFHFRGEPFWGNDRVALLEERLRAAGLAKS